MKKHIATASSEPPTDAEIKAMQTLARRVSHLMLLMLEAEPGPTDKATDAAQV